MGDFITQLEDLIYFGNSLLSYSGSAAVLIFGFLLLFLVKLIVISRLDRLAQKTSWRYDNVIMKSLKKDILPLAHFLVLYFCIVRLNISKSIALAAHLIIVVASVFFVVRSLLSMLVYWLDNDWVKGRGDVDPARKSASGAIATILKIVLWTIGALLILDNLGIKISAFIAGLGVGGVAIAFAAQAVLSDIFSYFSIFFDRPFELEDFIVCGEISGTIEHIGVKTTRIRSLSGEEVVISNADLTGSRLRNYKRMNERRVIFKIGVTYDTAYEKLEIIPGLMEEIVEGVELTRFDRSHFMQYGDSSLVFETVYYVLSNDYNVYCDVHQKVNLAVKREFDQRGIEFAFPTQTIYMGKQS